MRRTRRKYSSKKKKISSFRPVILLINAALMVVISMILYSGFKFIRMEIQFQKVKHENHQIMDQIKHMEAEIALTQQPDFLEIMARKMDMVKDGEYVIILPVEK